MELQITPAWWKAVSVFTLIDRAGLYQEPPIHKVIKCQELKNKKLN